MPEEPPCSGHLAPHELLDHSLQNLALMAMAATATKVTAWAVIEGGAGEEPISVDVLSGEDALSQSGERPIVRGGESAVVPSRTSYVAEIAPSYRPSYVGPIPQLPAFERTVDCFGVAVTSSTFAQVRSWFYAAVASRGVYPRVMYFANAHTMNLAWTDESFRDVLGRADVVLNDGIGLDLYGKLAGRRFDENLNGTDLLPRLFAAADAASPLRVFLYGAAPGRAEKAAKNIEARFPNVRVVGVTHGYERTSVVEDINEACADVVLVGMGNPVQERWIDENKYLLDVGVVVGVGALIDFLSGEVSRAPAWIRKARCEWIYRLLREPKRLFGRYVLGNPAFLARTVAYLAIGIRPAVAKLV